LAGGPVWAKASEALLPYASSASAGGQKNLALEFIG
jgi:hypothetical protein